MLEIRIDDKRLGFELTGHCGYAERGKDIVCAAISSLYLTYLLAVGIEESVDGECRSIYAPFVSYKNTVLHRAVAEGMRAIAEKYPENVKIID